MEFGINVDSLQNIVTRVAGEEKKQKQQEKEKYKTKIVEYTFFVQNEIEVSEKLNNIHTMDLYYNRLYRFLTIKKYDFVKICETNKQILEKMNLSLDLNKKIVLLKYVKKIDFCCDIDKMLPFIDSFLYNNHVNNKNIFHSEPRGKFIFWDFIRQYELLLNDLSFLSDKQILFLDFSSKNLLYDRQTTIFFNNFEKCLLQKTYNISQTDLEQHGDLHKLSKYIEIENYIDKFINIIESIEYYGNKHFDLYFSKQLIKYKNFHIVYQNLDTIMDDYLNNLYFLKNFSDKFKNDNKIKWKLQIKSKIEENVKYFNIDVSKLNWKLYLILLLEKNQKAVWEIFSANSLFLNITYHMMKIFAIKDKSSVIHGYFKFLFKNMDINCSSFNNNNNNNDNISISTCRDNYDKYRGSFQNTIKSNDCDIHADFLSLSCVTVEQQQELYDLLSQTEIIEQF
jgi:hypothetical protein